MKYCFNSRGTFSQLPKSTISNNADSEILDNGTTDVPLSKTTSRVTCPKCSALVCTKCRSLTHGGECPKTDLDPELESQLKKWKIKRCPKCRTGVRKVFGCPHIACRCGAHFCFQCLKPILQCVGCDDEDSVSILLGGMFPTSDNSGAVYSLDILRVDCSCDIVSTPIEH